MLIEVFRGTGLGEHHAAVSQCPTPASPSRVRVSLMASSSGGPYTSMDFASVARDSASPAAFFAASDSQATAQPRAPILSNVAIEKGSAVPYEPPDWLAKAIGSFGRAVREQLGTGTGEPEEALRGPLVALVKEVGSRHGLQGVPVGEAMLSDLQVRPDYAVQVDGAIWGYIEIKKPGLGADAPALTGKHNCRQWARLSNLPNLIYTDGTRWARYETGVRKGEIISLEGGLTEGSGDLRVTGPDFEQLLVTFLGWAPTPIRHVDALVRAVAPACRLLRDEVTDQLSREQLWVKAGSGANKQLTPDLLRRRCGLTPGLYGTVRRTTGDAGG